MKKDSQKCGSFFIYVREETSSWRKEDREEQAESIKRKSTYRNVSAFHLRKRRTFGDGWPFSFAKKEGRLRPWEMFRFAVCKRKRNLLPASAPLEDFHFNTGAAPRPCRLRPVPEKREKNRPVASAVGLSEQAQGASCAEGSDRPFFQGADVGGCSFLCFVSCLSGQEGNEDSNAAQSYRRKIAK